MASFMSHHAGVQQFRFARKILDYRCSGERAHTARPRTLLNSGEDDENVGLAVHVKRHGGAAAVDSRGVAGGIDLGELSTFQRMPVRLRW